MRDQADLEELVTELARQHRMRLIDPGDHGEGNTAKEITGMHAVIGSMLRFPVLPEARLDALVARLRTVEADLAAGPDRDTYVKLSREFSELQPLVGSIKDYRGTEREIADLDAMLTDSATDRDMRARAEGEKPTLEQKSDRP